MERWSSTRRIVRPLASPHERHAVRKTAGMRAGAAAGLGFLLAVLWFDLMFDIQVRSHRDSAELPIEVRDSIATYYRRVLVGARPMNRLVAVAMVFTLAMLVGQLMGDETADAVAVATLVLAAGAIGLAAARTVRNALRLGAQIDGPPVQTHLARRIFMDHIVCIVAVSAALVLQLTAA